MNARSESAGRLSVGLSVLVVMLTALPASGALITIADMNAEATFDLNTGADGMTSWTIDGVEHLTRQWFYYRTTAMTQEMPLDSLGYLAHVTSDTNPYNPVLGVGDSRDDALTVWYGTDQGNPGVGDDFYVEVFFGLHGGLPGTGAADTTEVVSFHNNTGSAVTLEFFQYANFDLGGGAGGDSATRINGHTVRQWDGGFGHETVVGPIDPVIEVRLSDAILAKLTDSDADNLDPNFSAAGPGDVEWALQWHLTVPAGGTVQVRKDKNMTPEPATVVLLAAGAGALLLRRRRRAG